MIVANLTPNKRDFTIWTVYRYPDDYPNHYIARCSIVRNGVEYKTLACIKSRTYIKIERHMRRQGLVRINRNKTDVPSIKECWV